MAAVCTISSEPCISFYHRGASCSDEECTSACRHGCTNVKVGDSSRRPEYGHSYPIRSLIKHNLIADMEMEWGFERLSGSSVQKQTRTRLLIEPCIRTPYF